MRLFQWGGIFSWRNSVLDLSQITGRIGAFFTKELKENVRSQTDINGRRFQIIAPSTARARASITGATTTKSTKHSGKFFQRGIVPRTGRVRKAVAKGVAITRLFFTEEFYKGAFQSKAEKDAVTIGVSRQQYPSHFAKSTVSFHDIVRYNNAGSPAVNRHIKNPPLIFPRTEDDVRKMKAWGLSQRLLASPETKRQIEQQMFQNALKKTVVNLTIGCLAVLFLGSPVFAQVVTTTELPIWWNSPNALTRGWESRWDTTVVNVGDSLCAHAWMSAPSGVSQRGLYSGGLVSCAVFHGELGCPDKWGQNEKICEKCLRREVATEERYIPEWVIRERAEEDKRLSRWRELDSLSRKK